MKPEYSKLMNMPEYLQAKLAEIKPEDYKSVFDFLTQKMIEGRDAMLLEIMQNNGVPTDNPDFVSSVQRAMMEYGDICEESLDVGVLSEVDLKNWLLYAYDGSLNFESFSIPDHVNILHQFQNHLAKVNKEWRKRK